MVGRFASVISFGSQGEQDDRWNKIDDASQLWLLSSVQSHSPIRLFENPDLSFNVSRITTEQQIVVQVTELGLYKSTFSTLTFGLLCTSTDTDDYSHFLLVGKGDDTSSWVMLCIDTSASCHLTLHQSLPRNKLLSKCASGIVFWYIFPFSR